MLPAVESRLAGHAMHRPASLPGTDLYVSSGQEMQSAPGSELYEPGKHTQLMWLRLPRGAVRPGGHSMHRPASLPATDLYVSPGQAVHVLAPSGW